MNSLKYLTYTVLVALFFLMIAGCGDNDNMVNTKTDNVVFQKDSLGISTTESGVVSLNNLISINLDSTKEYRIEFDGNTNLPDSLCMYGLSVYETNGVIFIYTVNEMIAVNTHHTLTASNIKNAVNFNAYISYINPIVINQYGVAYLWFLNIRVYVV